MGLCFEAVGVLVYEYILNVNKSDGVYTSEEKRKGILKKAAHHCNVTLFIYSASIKQQHLKKEHFVLTIKEGENEMICLPLVFIWCQNN
jgi:hypothetical protein